MPHLLVLIQRVPPKEKMKVLKYKSPKDEEPNFYTNTLQPLFMPTTLSSCRPNKSDQDSLPEDLNITPLPYGNRPNLALHYYTNQPAPHRYHPTTMTDIHHPHNQHPSQLTHPLQHQNNDWMCSVENDSGQQSTVRHVSEKNDGLNNDTKGKVDAVLQAFIKRSFERHNMEYKPTIASANGSAEGAHHYGNNDYASLIPCSRNDAAVEKNEEEMAAQPAVCQKEEDSRRLSLDAQDKPIKTSWLCRPCKNID
jgi:hypothetical protein